MFKPALGIRKVERDVPSSRRGRFPRTAGRLATGVLPTSLTPSPASKTPIRSHLTYIVRTISHIDSTYQIASAFV
jgi:hypothetical protein